jgi:hypothetical protein
MVGDPAISSYMTNQSSGGGGGSGTNGGGGGGTLELTAGGTLAVGPITSTGAAGGGGVTGGGGGAGGTIVLRAGSSATLNGNLTATAGAGGGGATASGSAGADGRIRVDASSGPTGTGTSTPAFHGGLMFDAGNAYIAQTPSNGIVSLTLHATTGDRFDLYTFQAGMIKEETDSIPVTAPMIPVQLHTGLNTVCAVPHVTPQLTPATAAESAACIDIAFLP